MSEKMPASAMSDPERPPQRRLRRLLMAGIWGLLGSLVGYGLMSRIAPMIWHHNPGPNFSDLGTLFKIEGSTWLAGAVGLLGGAIFGAWRCYAPRVSKRMLLVSSGLPITFLLAAVASEHWGWRQLGDVAWAAFCLTAVGFGLLVLVLMAERFSREV